MDFSSLLIIGMAFALNAIYAFFTHLDKKRSSEEKNKLIKAVLAKNVAEYARSEYSPKENIKELEVENDLAKHAAEVVGDQERYIPIT